jgi:alcohol dehydrogenase class IV
VICKFFMPTKVFLGKDCIIDNAAQLQALGKKAFVVTGRSSAKANGSLASVEAALRASKIAYSVFDRILSNPSIELVREAAKVAKEEGADFIIGIGGGSPMDAAKAIAVLAANEIDDTVLFSGPYPQPVLPIVAVPTTAGTGSEVTQYSILSDDRLQTKSSIANEAIFPQIAFLDASYTQHLPVHVTINTAIDALSHAIEGYLSAKATNISSMLAAESMTMLGKCVKVLAGKVDFAVREQLLYASMLAGMVIAHTGTTALHSMGYSLTYFKDIDHGRANGLLMYQYLEFISMEHPSIVAKIVSLLGMENLGELKNCLDRLLGDKELISASEIQQFSAKAIQAKNIVNTIRRPSQEDLAGIIERSFCG